jgi:uncharacterized protein (TIGR03083 family)
MPLDYLDALRREGNDLAVAAKAGPLDVPAPSCPGWDVADVVTHASRVHRWVTMALGAAGEPAGRFPKGPEDRGEAVAFFEDGLAALLDAFGSRPADAAAWNPFGAEPATVGFWRRRMAQETAVHRWDVQRARATTEAIEGELAADGIDEIMTFFAAGRLAQIEGGVETGGTVHVHCTDVAGEWTFAARGATFEVTSGHGKADVALRGPASELLLVLWGRRSLDEAVALGGVEVFGDRAVADRLLVHGMP